SDQEISGAEIRHRKSAFYMKFTPAPVIEKAKCRVAALLDFRDHQARTNRVDRSGRHCNSVAGMRQMPHQEIRNRAVIDGVTQLLRTDAPLHPQTDFSLERSIQDVPGFGFAVRQSGRLRIGIIRMNLDGKWLTR